jgi:tRNA modification GTPase
LLSTHERGRVLREGVPAAIVGRPNTGKSSLLNLLLGYDRAIVTGIAGTTRDTIEEKALVGGVLLRLIDTAGIRKADSQLEALGVERTFAALRGAGLAILVLDGSEPLRDEDFEALRSIPPGVPVLTAVNKSDLPCVLGAVDLKGFGPSLCHVSALSGGGMAGLEAEIKKLFPKPEALPQGELVTNARQAEAISRAAESVRGAIDAILASVTPDAVLTEVEASIKAIGEITGKAMREDVVARIFERFCVGK